MQTSRENTDARKNSLKAHCCADVNIPAPFGVSQEGYSVEGPKLEGSAGNPQSGAYANLEWVNLGHAENATILFLTSTCLFYII
jgi:hypothetical protein